MQSSMNYKKVKSVDDEAEKERLISEGAEGTATATSPPF